MNDGSQIAPIPRATLNPALAAWARPGHLAQTPSKPLYGRAGERADRAAMLQAAAEARTALEDAVIAAAVAAQRARSLTLALEEALAGLSTTEGKTALPSRAPESKPLPAAPLSPREKEVLALVAEGRSNKAIAETLFVSPNTIKTHVASLLNKLHAESRVQLAAIAARQAPI